MKKNSLPYISFWLPVLAGLLLLPVPLLGNFHVESAMLAAFIGCFWAGISGCQLNADESDRKKISFILRSLYLAGLPLFIFAVFTGCYSWSGLGFWVLYPVPSVLFGYAFGRMLRLWQVPFRQWFTVIFLLIVAGGIPLIEFFNLPQVYFYNHAWGGWPGPIYDETITVSWPLVFFRMLTVLWTVLFWFVPSFKKAAKIKAVSFFCAAALILGYSFLPQLGIISPRSYIQKQLGGMKETEHFIIYFEKKGFTKDEIKLAALEHEFYFQQITDALNINTFAFDEKIESYLYANAWQKNRLTGAKFTSYVPVWLAQDQLHIAKQQSGSLKHEMVHVLAKQFGNYLFNASWSIGLVEGLAVALSGSVSSKSTIHQIVAAEKLWPDAAAMKNALSLFGFYGGRSTVNYTTTGSFVRYLLNQYPVAYFKRAYATADIEAAYPQPFKKLVEGWYQVLRAVEIDSLDQQIAARLFSIPSIFEQACPHVLSPVARHLQNYRYYLTVEDTTAALNELTVLRNIAPENVFIKTRWMFLSLKKGRMSEVTALSISQTDKWFPKLLYADALALKGAWDKAADLLNNIEENSGSIPYLQRQAIEIRQNRPQWLLYLNLIYKDQFFKPALFERLKPYLQIAAIKKTIERERWPLFIGYVSKIIDETINIHFFDAYLQAAHYISFRHKTRLAVRLVEKLTAQNLRKRYLQRLQQEKRWVMFLSNSKDGLILGSKK